MQFTDSGKRQKRKFGSVVKINLGGGFFTYAHVLDEPLFAFYDVRSSVDLLLDEIIRKPILFKIWVMNSAVTSGRWIKVGEVSPAKSVSEVPAFFKQDMITKKYSIYRKGEDVQVGRAECDGLEKAAVWSPEHVEDRLRDHFEGNPNRWVESLRPR